ncbi:chaperonin GroES [Chaetoceros tenuissimus]|uniref:20 kDa chaperonin, chloroplastic n=1 Tax=Chaetoceros tenuissimus TaxID=426638 RepID=A0AAD3DAE2_9STRA|nr:chaperonin GroES [Chaetoceros tenuissimus]
MKFAALSSLLFATQVLGFAPSSFSGRSDISLSANVLEGREIASDFTPINNMLLVKKVEVKDQTEGGLFLTGKQKIDKSEGEVTACGDGKINSETGFQTPMPVSVGDSVAFGKFSGEAVKYNGVTHTLIRDEDILVKYPAGADKTIENVEVVWDNVLVKVEKKEIEETGGILIAATTKKASKSSVGEVLKVGPGRYAFNGVLMENDVVPGDMVKFRDFAAQEVEIDDEEYAVVRFVDLLAKF